MEKKMQFTKSNLTNIKTIIEEETGVAFHDESHLSHGRLKSAGFLAACLLCMIMTAAFTYYKLSSLSGDELAFSSAYQGDGRFDVVVTNLSDHALVLENQVKVLQWSTGEAVPGDPKKIIMKGGRVAPHSTEVIEIDLSEGYDVAKMAGSLQEGDWYYFVLTNNQFLFGQDWTCSIDFQEQDTDEVAKKQEEFIARKAEREKDGSVTADEDANEAAEACSTIMAYEEWAQPLEAIKVAGRYSDHVTLAGTEGEQVYAVADGTVTETGFDASEGNYLVLETANGILVKYGHLKEVKVKAGDCVKRTEKIATVGKTGMATGACLSLYVTSGGENVDPILY